jgi:hypothetical protein
VAICLSRDAYHPAVAFVYDGTASVTQTGAWPQSR